MYEAASDAPNRLIQLMNAPTRELFQTSLKSSLLQGAPRPKPPDAFELRVTDGHSTEQAGNDALGDADLTSMQGFQVSVSFPSEIHPPKPRCSLVLRWSEYFTLTRLLPATARPPLHPASNRFTARASAAAAKWR